MADKAVVTQSTLDAIGQAIISKGGATAPMTPAQMPAAIASIPSGGGGYGFRKPDLWPDLHDVLASEMAKHPDYQHATAFLLMNSIDNVTFARYEAYSTSDGAFYTTNASHTWDRSKDIDVGDAFKVRWVVAFNNGYTSYPLPFSGIGSCVLWVVGSEGVTNSSENPLNQSATIRCIELDVSNSSIYTLVRSGAYNFEEYKGSIVGSLTRCNNAFASSCIRKVPDVIDISGCNNAASMFSSCLSLVKVPDVLDVSNCTDTKSMFSGCRSLSKVPDVLNLSSSTNVTSMFSACTMLAKLPTHVTCNLSLSFADCAAVCDPDSVATFDALGNVVGGFVGNLNTCSNSGQTITFHANTKALFTADQWTAIKDALEAKNWGCSPA